MRRVAVIVAVILSGAPAQSHDWFTGLTNADGELCCGDKDCAPLADGDVTEVAGGYAIASLHVTVPYGQLQASPDGRWYLCAWGGKTRCFFGPMPAY